MTETFTISGDERPRMRSVAKLGAGVVLSDGRDSRHSLSEALKRKPWQNEEKPFFLVFRPVLETPEGRMEEMRKAVALMQEAQAAFSVPFALVIDVSRIRMPESASAYKAEVRELLAAAASLGVPLIPKLSILLGPEDASDIMLDPNADALFLSDAVAWSDLPEKAHKVVFRTKVSPLEKAGGGMVRGKYLLPLAVEWVGQLKRRFMGKPVITGAGMLRPRDVDMLKHSGASAIAMGVAATLRPWNVRRIVRRAKKVFSNPYP